MGLVRYLESRDRAIGVAVVSLSSRTLPEITQRMAAAGVPPRVLGLSKANPLGLLRVRREIACSNADVLQTHLEFSNTLGVLASAGLGRRRPAVIRTFHNVPSSQYSRLFLGLSRLASRWADYEVAVSEDIATALQSLGVPPEKIRVVRSTVHPDALEQPVDPAVIRQLRSGGSRLVGAVGRLVPQKNFGLLLRAVPRLLADEASTRVLVVGAGPRKSALESEARSIGVSDVVTFAGYRSDRAAVYRAMDVLAVTSRYEGLGLVIYEAMIHQVPVVATDISGCREAIRDGVDGLLVPSDDPEALANAILRLFREPELRERLVASARERMLEEHQPGQQGARAEALYREIYASSSR